MMKFDSAAAETIFCRSEECSDTRRQKNLLQLQKSNEDFKLVSLEKVDGPILRKEQFDATSSV